MNHGHNGVFAATVHNYHELFDTHVYVKVSPVTIAITPSTQLQ